ncbi:MAG TPA: molybdopterin-binding protein [Pelagibacteraceae bacterium]|jgi:molybdenum cofactor synthesis domain-containing protein|nr:molybdopterin-binding protein [Pelagibacteraceae bacterium]|tara:strand:+ start:2961 stop:3716 length:756 start_codon:yes stop_codon:yes gene_type:complete
MNKINKKVKAVIIVIGNEILSGRTQESNVAFLSKWLNDLGVRVEEVRVIADDQAVIVKCINEVRKKFKYVFTTGGIGPTHDDITSRSIAKAFRLSYGYNKEAYSILKKYYKPDKFNYGRKKMAKMPDKASLIYNPSSGAPGFIVGNVYCLPGVPSILKSMVSGLTSRIVGGKKILSKTISLSTVESEIAKPLEAVQNKFFQVEIGSYPFFRLGKIGVSIVIRSTEWNKIEDCAKQIQSFVHQKKIKIIKRE